MAFNGSHYLRADLSFGDNITEAAVVEMEQLTVVPVAGYGNLVRLKIGEMYIDSTERRPRLSAEKSDASIMISRDRKIVSTHGALTRGRDGGLAIESVFVTPMNADTLRPVSDPLFFLAIEGITAIPSTYQLDEAARLVHDDPRTRIPNLFELDQQLMWRILNDPALHGVLRKVFPNGYHCTTFSSNNLPAGEGEYEWHCDYPYHDIDPPYPNEVLGVQAVWTLDGFTRDNGATHFVPGSHRWPRDVDGAAVRQAVCQEGTIIIFLGSLWHTQGVNTTGTRRAALLANFAPLNVSPKDPIGDQVPQGAVIDGLVRFPPPGAHVV